MSDGSSLPNQDPDDFIDALFDGTTDGTDTPVYACATEGGFPCWPVVVERAIPKRATHTSTALIRRSAVQPDGTIRRAIDTFSAMVCVVLDDVLEKVPEPPLGPTAIIQTSPPSDQKPRGSYQYVYVFEEPVEDPAIAAQIYQSLAAAGLTDKGGTSPVRLFRLPGSRPPGKQHEARLVFCDWSRLFKAETLLDDMHVRAVELVNTAGPDAVPAPPGISVEDEVLYWLEDNALMRPGSISSAGYLAIRCPWADTHSDDRDAAGYRPATSQNLRRSFKCHHSHCATKTTDDFLAWVCDAGGPDEDVLHDAARQGQDVLARLLAGRPGVVEMTARREMPPRPIEGGPRMAPQRGAAAPTRPRDYDAAVAYLLDHAVYIKPRASVWLLNHGVEVSMRGLREDLLPCAIVEVGPKGGRKVYNPVDEWLANGDKFVTVTEPRLMPEQPRLVERDGYVVINTWDDPGFGPAEPGDAEHYQRFLSWVRHVAPEPGDADYLLDWMASKVQHPTRRQVAVVSITPTYGTGRSTLWKWFGAVVGHHTGMSAERLFGTRASQFNAHLESLLVTVNEVDTGEGDVRVSRAMITRLKDLVDPDNNVLWVERKGREGYTTTVYSSFLIASNTPGALPLYNGDRRFTVLQGNDEPIRSARPDLITWVSRTPEETILRAIKAGLMERDVSTFEPAIPRETIAKADAIEEAKFEVDRAIEKLLHVMGSPTVLAPYLLPKVMKHPRSPVYEDVADLSMADLKRQVRAYFRQHAVRCRWIGDAQGRLKVDGDTPVIRALLGSPGIDDEKLGRLELERFTAAYKALSEGRLVGHLTVIK